MRIINFLGASNWRFFTLNQSVNYRQSQCRVRRNFRKTILSTFFSIIIELHFPNNVNLQWQRFFSWFSIANIWDYHLMVFWKKFFGKCRGLVWENSEWWSMLENRFRVCQCFVIWMVKVGQQCIDCLFNQRNVTHDKIE